MLTDNFNKFGEQLNDLANCVGELTLKFGIKSITITAELAMRFGIPVDTKATSFSVATSCGLITINVEAL